MEMVALHPSIDSEWCGLAEFVLDCGLDVGVNLGVN